MKYRIRTAGTGRVWAEFHTDKELRRGEALDRLGDEIKARGLPANQNYVLEGLDLRLGWKPVWEQTGAGR